MTGKTKHHPYFPLFVDLSGRRVLVVGAGSVGMRRAGVLSGFGADVRIVAPEVPKQERNLPGSAAPEAPAPKRNLPGSAAPGAVWEKRAFVPEDVEGCFLVIAATDDDALNAQIVRLCRRKGIYVNHAGDQSQCDFYFPAVAMEENLVVGITSSGEDHGLVRRIAARLRTWLEQELSQE